MGHAHNSRNLTGERFGRLTVLSYEGRDQFRREPLYKVRCDCGAIVFANGPSLVRGATRSCGCLRKEKAAALARALDHNSTPVRVINQGGDISFFTSQAEAARALGCSPKTVWNCVKTGRMYRNNLIQTIR